MVLVREARVVVLQPVKAMHHVGATYIHSGVCALLSNVIVDVLFFLLLSQAGLVLVQLSVFMFDDPLQRTIWRDAVGVKVLVETVVLRAVQCPVLGLSSQSIML